MYKNLIIFFLLTLSVFSCKRKETIVNPGYEYFPMAKGDYKIYNVLSIQYSTTDFVTQSFQIKEVIADTFNINKEKRFRIERFKRASAADSWPSIPDSVWSATISSSKAIKIENNNRFIKLAFPISNGLTWNGNAENGYGEDLYSISQLGNNFNVSGTDFSNTLKVIQSPNDSNFVSKDYRMDVYVKDAGLIYRVKEQYSYKQDGNNFTKYIIDSGIKYYESLSSYGKQ